MGKNKNQQGEGGGGAGRGQGGQQGGGGGQQGGRGGGRGGQQGGRGGGRGGQQGGRGGGQGGQQGGGGRGHQGPGGPWPGLGQEQRGPPQQQQQQRGPPQQQQGGPRPLLDFPQLQQQQQRGPPQQQQQQQGPPQQQQRGPPQQQQGGPRPQLDFPQLEKLHIGPPQQQQQQRQQEPPQQQQPERGPPQGQRRDSEASQSSVAEQVLGPKRGPPSEAGSLPSTKSTASVELIDIPARKVFGQNLKKKGKLIMVDVNHMELKLANYNMTVYHYDVVFDPDKPKFLLRPAIEKLFKKNFPGRVPIFDGQKNLFTAGQLDDKLCQGEVMIFNEESQKEKKFVIHLACVAKIDMSQLLTYQKNPSVNIQLPILVLDVALRSLCSTRFIQNGRRFFTPPNQTYTLGNGLELWHGHYQSATLGWKPYLCLDISNTAFYTASTIEKAMCDVVFEGGPAPNSVLDRYSVETFTSFLKGVKVDYEIPGVPSSKRTYRVNGVVGPPNTETFEDENKKKWTIFNYYREIKKYNLRKQFLPCLWVGSRDRTVRLPGELCRISPNQSCNRKLDEKQTASMVRSATTNTKIRRDHIMAASKNSGMMDPNPYMKEFGISVSGQFERIEGRILDAPPLKYSNNQVNPREGQWRAGVFVNASPLKKWAILNLARNRDNELQNLEQQMIQGGRQVGMAISPASEIDHFTARAGPGYEKALIAKLHELKGQNMEMIMVVVPNAGDTYAKVKTCAEIHVGVLTQCIKSNTVFKLKPATVTNILLKVNAKLDGMNHHFADNPRILSQPVMIVGADVTHPSPGQMNTPSIAAVAASHDKKAFKYNMIWRMQPKGEMIIHLESIMREQLMFFYSTTKCKPVKIIFFRDGVSEGEIQKVMSIEIGAIRRACKSLGDGSYQPQITFLVVQKRHHTRFFPVNDRDIYDKRNFNLPAGTVVDTNIVHPTEIEFILLSHASILGTARPTKYRLVYDDSNFSEEELEEMSYYLCHLFTRCTRSVSYPAPTYYAHLAAFRARNYIDHRLNLADLENEQRRKTLNPELKKNNPMFFV